MMYMYVVYFRLSPLYNAIDVAFGANLKFKPACLMMYMYTVIKSEFSNHHMTMCVSQTLDKLHMAIRCPFLICKGRGLFQVGRVKVNVPGWEG